MAPPHLHETGPSVWFGANKRTHSSARLGAGPIGTLSTSTVPLRSGLRRIILFMRRVRSIPAPASRRPRPRLASAVIALIEVSRHSQYVCLSVPGILLMRSRRWTVARHPGGARVPMLRLCGHGWRFWPSLCPFQGNANETCSRRGVLTTVQIGNERCKSRIRRVGVPDA
jgi:hypothetical protein